MTKWCNIATALIGLGYFGYGFFFADSTRDMLFGIFCLVSLILGEVARLEKIILEVEIGKSC